MSVSVGVDANANTGGGGALQLLEMRLLEDGGERGGEVVARGSVAVETAGEDGERAVLSRGADRTLRTLAAARAHACPLRCAIHICARRVLGGSTSTVVASPRLEHACPLRCATHLCTPRGTSTVVASPRLEHACPLRCATHLCTPRVRRRPTVQRLRLCIPQGQTCPSAPPLHLLTHAMPRARWAAPHTCTCHVARSRSEAMPSKAARGGSKPRAT